MAIKQILLLFSMLVHLGLLIFVLLRSRRTTTNLLFSLFLFVNTLWVASAFAVSFKWGLPLAGQIGFALGGLAGPVFILFFLSFIGLPLRSWHALLGLPALVNFVGSLTGMVILGFSKTVEFQPEYGPLFPFWAITTVFYVIGVITLVFWTYLSSKDPFKRAQLMFPMLAVLFTSILALVGYLVIPLIMGVRGGGFGLLHIALLAVPMAFTYSIIRYRYMDMTVALRVFFVFLIKVVLLALLITVSLLFLGLFTSTQSVLYILLIATLVSVAFFLLGGILESTVDRAVFKTHYNYRHDIRRFGTELAGVPLMGLAEITQFLSAKLNDLMGVRSVELFLNEGESFRRTSQQEVSNPQAFEASASSQKRLSEFLEHYEVLVKEELKHAEPERYKTISSVFEELGSALFIPLRLRGSLIGFMGLGEKASGDLYTNEDIHFLTTIGGQTAVAVDNARLYHDAIERNKELSEKEEALRESEERFRTLFESAGDAIFLIKDDQIIDCNQKTLDLFGCLREHIIGKTPDLFSPSVQPDGRDSKDKALEKIRAASEGKPQFLEWQYVKYHADSFDAEVSLNRVELGGCVHIQAIVRDISERKKAEEQKKKLEAQLQRSQKMEAIGTLAGGVAHDLNNILSAIVGYPDLLLMEIPENSPLRQPIQTIQKSGQKAAAIVQDLLTLARRGVSVAEVVNLNKIIEDYLSSPEFEKLRSEHPHVEVEKKLHPDLLNVLGSSAHLSKTLMNLFSNAAEAMPIGGKIYVSTENQYLDSPLGGYDNVKEGDYVLLTVSDEGVGISPEEVERIFEPFYTKKVMGRSGTGLGMAVIWGTVKDHNGYIHIETAKGKGTTFKLYFPITRKEISKDMDSIPLEDYMGGGQKILVIDDIKEQRDIASHMLTRLGYVVWAVSSGEEAVEYLKMNSVDLLLLDMIMDPGMDGLDTYKKIVELHPKQKAVIASGYSETHRVKEAQKLGAGAYIKKPYTLIKLGLAVKKEIGK